MNRRLGRPGISGRHGNERRENRATRNSWADVMGAGVKRRRSAPSGLARRQMRLDDEPTTNGAGRAGR